MSRYNLNVAGETFTDELIHDAGSSALQLEYGFFTKQDLQIWDGAGFTGNQLVEGVDFTLSEEDILLSQLATQGFGAGRNVYRSITIINVAYQSGDLFFSGKYIGEPADSLKRDWKEIREVSTTHTVTDTDGDDGVRVTCGANDVSVFFPAASRANKKRKYMLQKPYDDGVGEIVARIVGDTHGTGCFKCVKWTGAGTPSSVYFTDNADQNDLHGMTPGATETKSILIYIPSASGILGSEIVLRIQDYQGGWQVTDQAAANLYDQWQTVTCSRAIRGSATGATALLQVNANASVYEYFYADNLTSVAGAAIDRGDCESVTSPMYTGETVPLLSGCYWYIDQPPGANFGQWYALRVGLPGQQLTIMSVGDETNGYHYEVVSGVIQPVKGEPDVGGGLHRFSLSSAVYKAAADAVATPAASAWSAAIACATYLPRGVVAAIASAFAIPVSNAAGDVEIVLCYSDNATTTPSYRTAHPYSHTRFKAAGAGETEVSVQEATLYLDASRQLYVYCVVKTNCSATHFITFKGYFLGPAG